MKKSTLVGMLCSGLILAGCSSDDNSDAPSVSDTNNINGQITVDDGFVVPVNGEIAVFWSVSSGSPDYSYISTGTLVSDTAYALELPASLQQEAINDYGVAVGVMTVFSSGAAPGEGILSAESEMNAPAGLSENHAVIYKTAEANDDILGWSSEFPTGYSCGLVQRAENDEGFDSFTPVSCDEVTIRVGDIETFDSIDWT